MAAITITLDDDTQRILDKMVKEAGIGESDVITRAIRIANGSFVTQVLGPKGVV